MEKYLEGEEITKEEIKTAIRKATCNVKLFPLLCGSAFKNKGVQLLLDAVIDYCHHHLMFLLLKVLILMTVKKKLNVLQAMKQPFSALAFKIMTDPFVGKSNILPCIFWYFTIWFLCI